MLELLSERCAVGGHVVLGVGPLAPGVELVERGLVEVLCGLDNDCTCNR